MAANPHDLISGTSTEALAGAAFFVGTVLATIISYFLKKPPPMPVPDATVVGVGLELGNRHQMDMLIAEQKRCADSLAAISSYMAVLADRKQEAIEDKLDTLLDRLGEKERRS